MRAGIDGRLHMLHRLVELYVLAATGKRVNQRSGMFLLSMDSTAERALP